MLAAFSITVNTCSAELLTMRDTLRPVRFPPASPCANGSAIDTHPMVWAPFEFGGIDLMASHHCQMPWEKAKVAYSFEELESMSWSGRAPFDRMRKSRGKWRG